MTITTATIDPRNITTDSIKRLGAVGTIEIDSDDPINLTFRYEFDMITGHWFYNIYGPDGEYTDGVPDMETMESYIKEVWQVDAVKFVR